ncbi:MAG TPA: ABC transporter ATP-binding protein [Longimicrobiales bacterium]|nr:ABC transporter ATP-binding protein [Longimicrobiales bacterium]
MNSSTMEQGRGMQAAAHAPAVSLDDVRFAYTRGNTVLHVPGLRVERGERVFIYGPSGSGKTTLLGLVAGVLRADSGAVHVLGTDLTRLSDRRRDALRAGHIGYIFQLFNLIPYLSVEENIVLPCRVSAERRARLGSETPEAAARRLASSLALDALMDEGVTRLSVGQQQRVAAARALIGAPELVIADEPTSALDSDRREGFLQLLFERCRDAGSTLLFVSHDRQLEHLFDRALSLTELNREAAR